METYCFPWQWLIIPIVKNGSVDVAIDHFKMTKQGKKVQWDLYNLLVGVCGYVIALLECAQVWTSKFPAEVSESHRCLDLDAVSLSTKINFS